MQHSAHMRMQEVYPLDRRKRGADLHKHAQQHLGAGVQVLLPGAALRLVVEPLRSLRPRLKVLGLYTAAAQPGVSCRKLSREHVKL